MLEPWLKLEMERPSMPLVLTVLSSGCTEMDGCCNFLLCRLPVGGAMLLCLIWLPLVSARGCAVLRVGNRLEVKRLSAMSLAMMSGVCVT